MTTSSTLHPTFHKSKLPKRRSTMDHTSFSHWPEPVIPVQALSEDGIQTLPYPYIKPPQERPVFPMPDLDIPVVDLAGGAESRRAVLQTVADACKYGFFQVVNHGVDVSNMERVAGAWRRFFALPMEEKKLYSNTPAAYEGYGSRAGVEKGAPLDWGDYFFLNVCPSDLKTRNKWPKSPRDLRELTEEYGHELMNLCEVLIKAISLSLGLDENYLHEAFGGSDGTSASMRVNYYPKCPQPELTLAISSHADAGGIAVLLVDDHTKGTQVLKDDTWYTVQPMPNAFIVNIGDQIQIISNDMYKSVEHRALASSDNVRLTIAFFYNPRGDLLISPAKELVGPQSPALYKKPITFNEYRKYARTRGMRGKSQLESLKIGLCPSSKCVDKDK